MIIKELSIENFRNIKSGHAEFSPTVNIFLGKNAQGKTNILESIWLFSGNKSFRGSKDIDFINFDENKAQIDISFFKNERNQTAKIVFDGNKKAFLNDIPLTSQTEFLSELNMTVFIPSHLSLIKDGPGERRKFINSAIASIYPNYISILQKYYNSVAERNKILKDSVFHSQLLDILFVYEEQIAKYGSKIISVREKYIKRLEETAKDIYFGISGEKENINLEYFTKINPEDKINSFKEQLFANRKEDMFRGTTSVGPHRDDINITINGKSAREFGSQGQQRSAVLSIKLAESEIQNQVFGEKPVILLDDVMSELDLNRQEYLLNYIDGSQIFITSCEKNKAKILDSAKIFKVESGKIDAYGE